MGLNETYAAVRSQILLMQPLPLVNRAYSMIVQEELKGVFPLFCRMFSILWLYLPLHLATSAPTFIPQQYSQILDLLNKSQATTAPAVNCAGSLQWQDEGDW
ncbi:uncharacterized protein [Gossypium hirsutum]|uniref:Uncharacterized protein n=1 Tax=Gossypium hirsutum TaxID=3635 RepID=A0ABM2Z443_GOSHI|nr:uncharacterized protein LOC121209842 [Gossypium hirsutum]XP_040937494.1 uncharacterized protein LOC121209842 [Gossypium hirsutum]